MVLTSFLFLYHFIFFFFFWFVPGERKKKGAAFLALFIFATCWIRAKSMTKRRGDEKPCPHAQYFRKGRDNEGRCGKVKGGTVNIFNILCFFFVLEVMNGRGELGCHGQGRRQNETERERAQTWRFIVLLSFYFFCYAFLY